MQSLVMSKRYALVELAARKYEVHVATKLAEPLVADKDPDTHWYLGFLSEAGYCLEPNLDEARRWYEKGAALGSRSAVKALEALDAKTKAEAEAEAESVESETENDSSWPAFPTTFGEDLSPCSLEDQEQSYGWYRSAADNGDPRMKLLVGMLYEFGIHVRRNERKALKWYSSARRGGVLEADIWFQRLDYKRSSDEHNKRWQEATYARNEYIVESSRKRLGPEPANDVEAFKWYLGLAEKGDPDAQVQVCIRYLNGQGVKKDLMRCQLWLWLACEGHQDENVKQTFDELRRFLPNLLSGPNMARAHDLATELRNKWRASGAATDVVSVAS
jgi:TPR repeat protein